MSATRALPKFETATGNHDAINTNVAIAGHIATNISAALTVIILRIQQSTPDSKALNPVSGKSRSKEILRARPVWTVYSIAHAKYMAPPTSQPTVFSRTKAGHECREGCHRFRLFLTKVPGEPLIADVLLKSC